MAKNRMPVWQSSMKWTSDVLADGARWKKAVVYVLFVLILAGLVALISLTFAERGSGNEGSLGDLFVR